MRKPELQLDEERLLEVAEGRAGLGDFGDGGFRKPLRRLLEHLKAEEELAPATRTAAVETITELLVDRLRFVADRKRYPIAEERIERPILITGQARSGTTLMHSLLGEDPANRLPRFWEVVRPSPPVGFAEADDPRIEQGNADMQTFIARMKRGMASHPYWDEEGMMPVECTRLSTIDFRNMSAMAFWRVPISKGWVLSSDVRAHYAFHKKMLQNLQYGADRARWVMKGAAHYTQLEEALETYPDAIILWMHRDPVKAISSRLELEAIMAEGITGQPVDRAARAVGQLAAAQRSLEAVLSDPLVEHPAVFHIRFVDWVGDPIATLRRVYQHFDLEFTRKAEEGMKRWLSDPKNKSDRYGRFRYSLEPFGMSADEMDELFRPYRERFGLPRELPAA
ncbi:MAG: sulfotransferase family protein [Deltaproteobacteria bacterium]|nr:sulfotransferase family protein [Deltaproteobacteria bacterium]